MALFTLPHTYTETCAELRVIMRSAWTFFLQGKAWKAARKRWGITGYIRAMEVTHGANGWHPHLHVLFLTSALSESDADELRVWIGERWANVVKRISGKEVRLGVGFGFQKACSVSAAGDYVAKWGADSEIAKASSKVSRKGGRSPWQLLADAGNGDHRARFLFAEYAAAMKGSRHLTWSVGLRDMYLSEPEKDDYELACDDAPHHGDMVIGALRRGVWHRVCRAGLIPELLNSAEAEGWAGVLALLRAHRLALPEAIYVNRRKQNDLHAS
ncbi:MAG: hypothetical protein EPO08_03525 [Rhodospirillaceae bacterium]|nr:MAG: hypothetical protein EPO08_03525 [Rhodospirillaceae bacterium]